MTGDDRPEPLNVADLLKREGMAPTRGRRRSGRRHAPPETPAAETAPSASGTAEAPAAPTETAHSAEMTQIVAPAQVARPDESPFGSSRRTEGIAAEDADPPATTSPEPPPRMYPPPVPSPPTAAPAEPLPPGPGPPAATSPPAEPAGSATDADEPSDELRPKDQDAAPPRGKPSWRKRHPALLAAIVLGVVLVLGVAYYATVLLVAQDRITREAVLRVNGPEILEPQLQTDTQTYLIVVSDSAAKSGSAEVTALAHLSADESRLVIVSFPRETLVDVPACGSANRPVSAFTGTLAATYARGGGRCSVAAVQALTGIRINHYLGVDLARFPKMIDSLGGVSVCLTAPLRDPDNGVSLPAGQTELTGTQATDYVRAVAGGAGADPARASRQISFLSTVFSEALGASTLANPVRVTKFAFAVADVLSLDPDTSLGDLRDLGSHLRDLSAGRETGKVSIVVPPVTPVGSGDTAAAYEALDPDQSRAMFDAIIAGQPIPDISTQPPASSAPPADPSASGPPSSPSTAAASPAPVVTDC